jgi:hypothetical protein
MDNLKSFADVIGLWKTAGEMAADIEVTDLVVRAWKRRNAIPGEYWARIVSSAEARGYQGVTLDLLASFAEKNSRGVAA